MKRNVVIMLSRSRTGSNFLMGMLNNHPGMTFKGEIFKRVSSPSPKQVISERFSKVSSEWIGFKIFYYHAPELVDAIK